MARPIDPVLRTRLIRVASREFAARGFAGANLARIGEAASVTKGGVYFHFRSKDDLFFAAVDHWREALRVLFTAPSREAADRPEGPDDPEAGPAKPQTLRDFLVAYLRFHFQHPEASGLLRVLAAEMRGRFTAQVRDDHRATQRGVRARIRELLMQGTDDGSLFTTDPALATFILAAAVEGVLNLVSGSPRGAEPFRHPESIVDFLLAAYETGSGRAAPGRRATGGGGGVDFIPTV